MEIKFKINPSKEKQDTICTAVSFPVTESQKLAVQKLRDKRKADKSKFDINEACRLFLDQVIKQMS